MGIKVVWDSSELRIIRWDFDRTWTPNDLTVAEQATDALLSQRPDIVIDFILNMVNVPFWTGDFFVFRNSVKRMSRGTGIKIIVGASPLLQQFITKLSKYDQSFVEGLTLITSLDEARELISS